MSQTVSKRADFAQFVRNLQGPLGDSVLKTLWGSAASMGSKISLLVNAKKNCIGMGQFFNFPIQFSQI